MKREVTFGMVMSAMRRNVGLTCTDLGRLLGVKSHIMRPILVEMVATGFLVQRWKDKDTLHYLIPEFGEWPTRPGIAWNTNRDLADTDYVKNMRLHRELCEATRRK